jgi:hypothetical protein
MLHLGSPVRMRIKVDLRHHGERRCRRTYTLLRSGRQQDSSDCHHQLTMLSLLPGRRIRCSDLAISYDF